MLSKISIAHSKKALKCLFLNSALCIHSKHTKHITYCYQACGIYNSNQIHNRHLNRQSCVVEMRFWCDKEQRTNELYPYFFVNKWDKHKIWYSRLMVMVMHSIWILFGHLTSGSFSIASNCNCIWNTFSRYNNAEWIAVISLMVFQ